MSQTPEEKGDDLLKGWKQDIIDLNAGRATGSISFSMNHPDIYITPDKSFGWQHAANMTIILVNPDGTRHSTKWVNGQLIVGDPLPPEGEE